MMIVVELPAPRGPGPYRVCLVCTGNICRSPMAEVVLRVQAGGLAVVFDSAGTGDWHAGEPMYPLARAALAARGYDGEAHRSRQFQPAWLGERDLILAMDMGNLNTLTRMGGKSQVRLFGAAGDLGCDAIIPDPYGGTGTDFSRVLDLIEQAAPVITARLARLAAG